MKTVATTGSGTTAEQSFTVDAPTLTRATYAQSGTTVTVTLSSHLLKVGGAVYLNFAAGTGGTATSAFTPWPPFPRAAPSPWRAPPPSPSPAPCGHLAPHRQCGHQRQWYRGENLYHRTAPDGVGNNVTIYGSGSLDGSRISTVATVPDAYTFTRLPTLRRRMRWPHRVVVVFTSSRILHQS